MKNKLNKKLVAVILSCGFSLGAASFGASANSWCLADYFACVSGATSTTACRITYENCLRDFPG